MTTRKLLPELRLGSISANSCRVDQLCRRAKRQPMNGSVLDIDDWGCPQKFDLSELRLNMGVGSRGLACDRFCRLHLCRPRE